MVCSVKEFAHEKVDLEMLHGADYSIHLEFVNAVRSLCVSEFPAEQADGMFEASVGKRLIQIGAKGHRCGVLL